MTLCDEFARLSGWIWSLIGFTQPNYPPKSIGLRETTITDLLIWKLSAHGQATGECVVSIPSEIATGADFDFIVVEGNVGTHFRFQAKRLYTQGRQYKSVGQLTKDDLDRPIYQIDTLCTAKAGFIPFYVFYNFYAPPNTQDEQAISGKGCCITAATTVRRLLSKPKGGYLGGLRLAQLAPLEMPWEKLVCPPPAEDLSVHALNTARQLGALEGGDWGNVRRPLEGQYLRLWVTRGETEGDGEEFDRPVIMVGRR